MNFYDTADIYITPEMREHYDGSWIDSNHQGWAGGGEYVDGAFIESWGPTNEFIADNSGNAGFDLRSSLDLPLTMEGVRQKLKVGDSWLIPTGIHLAINPGLFGIVKCKSSIASKGLRVEAGVIDSSYRGEIQVLLRNVGNKTFFFGHDGDWSVGRKIAQIIFMPHKIHLFSEVDSVESLGATDRGAGGFGSTGTH